MTAAQSNVSPMNSTRRTAESQEHVLSAQRRALSAAKPAPRLFPLTI